MQAKFNIDEILEMAEQIERNGATFYQRASEIVPADSTSRRLLLILAEMEINHEAIFASMRKDILKHEKIDSIVDPEFDPDGLAAMYLRSIANSQVFDLNKPDLSGNESPETILKMALEREKDAIVFYLGLKEAVAENLGRNDVDLIIKEEMSHITYISEELAKLPKLKEQFLYDQS